MLVFFQSDAFRGEVFNLFAWVAHAGARGAESGRAQPRPVTPEAPLLLQRRISIRRRRRLAERMAAVVRAITAGRRERADGAAQESAALQAAWTHSPERRRATLFFCTHVVVVTVSLDTTI